MFEEHRKFHQEHAGHEQMHAEMLLIFLVVLIVVQIILIEWKRRYNRSYMVSFVHSILNFHHYFYVSLVYVFRLPLSLLCGLFLVVWQSGIAFGGLL